MGHMLGTNVLMRGLRAAFKGHMIGIPIGDVFQMPGVFLIDRKGVLHFTHYAEDVSDNPSNELILASIPKKTKS